MGKQNRNASWFSVAIFIILLFCMFQGVSIAFLTMQAHQLWAAGLGGTVGLLS